MITIPPHLQQGDTIAIVCPAGYMPYERAQTCITTLQQWGFKVKIGKTLGSQFNYFSGTDEQRLQDLQAMLDDTTVKAILCGRGGYGVSRIVDQIDFSAFKQTPKWVIGYSDITVLHTHLYNVLQTASLHSPMAAAFNDGGANSAFVQSLHNAITGGNMEYSCPAHTLNRQGSVEGELVGGNLTLIAHLIGSASAINTTSKILFLEDVGEYVYNVDRMFMQLKRAGMLDGLAGLIIGSFSEMKDTIIPFGQQVFDAIFDKVKEYSYPVCFDFPVGHTANNYALKVGIKHTLTVSSGGAMLKEA